MITYVAIHEDEMFETTCPRCRIKCAGSMEGVHVWLREHGQTCKVAGGAGVEPASSGPKSDVLPIERPAINFRTSGIHDREFCPCEACAEGRALRKLRKP